MEEGAPGVEGTRGEGGRDESGLDCLMCCIYIGPSARCGAYLTCVCKVVLQKSNPSQIRQLTLHYY